LLLTPLMTIGIVLQVLSHRVVFVCDAGGEKED
jgi:hypothetical protein